MSQRTFREPYAIDEKDSTFWKNTEKGVIQLTNFTAEIKVENVYHDGDKITTTLEIHGYKSAGTDPETGLHRPPVQLPVVIVTAAEFQSGSWIADKWGMQTIVFPTPNSSTDVRACIQILSADTSKRVDIYTHTGWAKINGKPAYLTTSGAIGPKKLDRSVKVVLPQELKLYSLPDPDPKIEDFTEAMRLINIGPKHVTWCLLLSTIRAVLGNNDFAVHVAGRTGTYKSEITSLFQSFFGEQMDARHLPCSWNSTANALEALAYRTKDSLVVVDDFVPQGTNYAVRALQQKADSLIRAQGNQTGRSRLTDMSNVQAAMYPRGIILSTGEDIPEGHSVRGRMMILEISPGEIAVDKLTAAQKARPAFSRFMSSFISWWTTVDHGQAWTELCNTYRKEFHGIGHARTPSIMAALSATAYVLCEYAKDHGFYADQMPAILEKALAAVRYAGEQQQHYLHGTDPVTMFSEILRGMLAIGKGHMKTRHGGIPADAPTYGWKVETHHGDMPTYTSQGPKLGWVDIPDDELYFDPNAIQLIKAASNGRLAVNNQTLIKRMKEAGLLLRTDAARQRNTVRVKLDGHPQTVLVMRLSEIMDLGDAQNHVGADDQKDAEE